jgi:hypothetical protein
VNDTYRPIRFYIVKEIHDDLIVKVRLLLDLRTLNDGSAPLGYDFNRTHVLLTVKSIVTCMIIVGYADFLAIILYLSRLHLERENMTNKQITNNNQ